jgi:Spy/CpxP family protein refolding chaperone
VKLRAVVTLWLAAVAGPSLAEGGAVAHKEAEGIRLRDEIYEMVDAYVVMKVQERLELSDEQLTRLMPLIRKQQKDRRELDRRRFRALGEMRRLFAEGAAREDQIAELLREIKAVDVEAPPAAQRNQEAIDAALTPMQQAKYRLLMMEVEHRLRELRHRARQGGRGGPQRRGLGQGPR